VTGDNIHYR